MEQTPDDNCLFVMFGATGDLMQRKLLPALFQLSEDGLLPPRYQILGVARDPAMDDARFRLWVRQALADAHLPRRRGPQHWCEECIAYQSIADGSAANYRDLAARIAAIEAKHELPGNRVLYLALPPQAFPDTIAGLAKSELTTSPGWTRLVIEKPFGHDLESARHLNELIHHHFDESQVYRIDHYLGKETVQNLLTFRFGNALFESAWNREHVKSVQITVAEAIGIENRAAYYERTGALRDIIQNHLMQLLTLTAMEAPVAFDAESIRHEKTKVLRSILPIKPHAAVFGQYTAQQAPVGEAAQETPFAGDGQQAILWNALLHPGYRSEPDVAPGSTVETYVALRLAIENWRWQGVPFFLRTGKRLARRLTQIVIEFRGPPVALFRSIDCSPPHTNRLAINLQPDEGFTLSFEVKAPGDSYALHTRHMQFRYADAFGTPLSAGYETLLLDVVQGDQTLFVHADETEASWRLYTPLLHWHVPRHSYPAGSWGPAAADKLIGTADGAWSNE